MSMPKREPLRRAILLLFAALLAAVAGLAACSPYQVSERSMNFNDALQDLDNRQVLLNAVRAYKRYPLYYTAVNQISSTGELDGSQVNFSLPFGPVSHNVNSVAPMIKVGTGITLQTNPLDTQDFYEGYMQPIKTDLVGYYIDYGWPRQVIVHAFLREIDLPQDIVEGVKVRLRQVFDYQHHPDCTEPGGFADCLSDILSDPDLLAKMSLPETDPRSLRSCRSLIDLNTLTVGERAPADAHNSLVEAYMAAAKAGNEIIRFVNEPAEPCRFATFQLLSAMLDKLELAVVPVSTPSSAAKPITVPTSQAGLSIKIQNDAASSGTAKTAFALSKVMDPCVLKTGNEAAFIIAAKIAAAGPDVVAPNPLVLRTKGDPVPSDSAAPATPAAPATHSGAHPAGHAAPPAAQHKAEFAAPATQPPPAAPAEQPAAPAPPAKAVAKVVKAPAQANGKEPWQTFCTDEEQVQVVPRSPEAIVFYLGEMIEREYRPPPGVEPEILTVRGGGPKPRALFHVVQGDRPGPSEVSVSLDGETYSIPRGEEFRSTMSMLTLTEQVIGLQKKGTQIPGIVPVQVINP